VSSFLVFNIFLISVLGHPSPSIVLKIYSYFFKDLSLGILIKYVLTKKSVASSFIFLS